MDLRNGETRSRRPWSHLPFLMPAMLFLVVFIFVPTAYVVYLSFFKWNLLSSNPKFIGLQNYIWLFSDSHFLQALKNSGLISLGMVKSGNALVESGPNYWDLMTQDFIKGKIAMDIDSIGDAAEVKKGVGSNFDWGTAFVPSDKTLFVPPGGGDMAVMAGIPNDHIKAAETFIEWWTSPSQTLEWSKLTGYLPVQKAAVNQPSYQTFLKQNPEFKTAIDELKYQHPAPASANLLGVLQNVQQELQGIFDEGKVPQQAMSDATDQANQLLH